MRYTVVHVGTSVLGAVGPEVVDRLERRGARAGLNKSRLAERYIDEGMRMEDHPGIVFRDGPTGRRAGLAAGPDVWEVMSALRSTGLEGDEAVAATAEWSGLTSGRFAMRSAITASTRARSTSGSV